MKITRTNHISLNSWDLCPGGGGSLHYWGSEEILEGQIRIGIKIIWTATHLLFGWCLRTITNLRRNLPLHLLTHQHPTDLTSFTTNLIKELSVTTVQTARQLTTAIPTSGHLGQHSPPAVPRSVRNHTSSPIITHQRSRRLQAVQENFTGHWYIANWNCI